MSYTAANVGKKMVDGVAVELSLAERETKAAKWNTEEVAQAARIAAQATREGRLTALSALISNGTATNSDVLAYLSLRDLQG